jgi:hypothetical protein
MWCQEGPQITMILSFKIKIQPTNTVVKNKTFHLTKKLLWLIWGSGSHQSKCLSDLKKYLSCCVWVYFYAEGLVIIRCLSHSII